MFFTVVVFELKSSALSGEAAVVLKTRKSKNKT
jgi:hypothetical protein